MKKITLILAALLLSVPTVSLFASCGEKGTPDDNAQGEKGETSVSGNEDRLSYDFSPNIPEGVKFDGETFSMLIGSTGQSIYAETENSDLVNDANFRRNNLVAEHFGVTMNIVKTGAAATGEGQQEATAQFRSLIEANDDTYHSFVHVQHTGMPQMILEKYFVDWNTVPYVNLDDEWWHQGVRDELCFGDKVYVMTGDYALYIDKIDCLLFNKSVFDELGLEYPYQDVLDGTWTWDKFEELIKKGAKDLNGDGIMKYGDDRWGLLGWQPELLYALLISSGYSPLEKDENNMPVLNQNVDETHAIYDRIVNLFKDRQYAWAETSDYMSQHNGFSEGKAMFKDLFLGSITTYSDVDFDFGILPYPKWDEDSEYQNRSSNMTALTYIPVTNPNIPMTGAVLEEMAFQSAKELTPIYFDIVLTVKNTRDVESEAMLPIIKNNARFLYDGYTPNINHIVMSGNNTYASDFASKLSSYQEQLDEMRELLEN